MPDAGICKLCYQEAPLVRRSHIFSNFLVSPLFDEHNKLVKFKPSEFLESGSGIVSRPQHSPYQKDILCHKCDNEILSTYENYASKLLFGKQIGQDIASHYIKRDGLTVWFGIDYHKLKLFILSLLWRSHITELKSEFDVALGPYAERIRKMLIHGDATKDTFMPIVIGNWINTEGTIVDFVAPPVGKINDKGHIYYIISFHGLVIYIYISKNSIPNHLRKYRLSSRGYMSLLQFSSDQANRFFHGLYK